MTSDLHELTKAAWQVLSGLPDSAEAISDQRRRWDDLRASDAVRMVIFGAYDAGKSTLLKRLLVDAGTRVPDWLTISGRRETFELRSVRSEGIVFLDTPGLSGGNDHHEEISLDAMKLADAYLWVLPPQLVTANRQVFLDFVSGRHFNGSLPESIVADATTAVVARMDEAGIDPADNPEGFQELAARKTAEFRSLLGAGGIEADLRSIHCVAADAYQMVGSNPAPERELYDHGREWDGINALADSLSSLCAERRRLRAAAGARFVVEIACDARDKLRTAITADEHTREACANEIEHHRRIEQRLNALARQAQAEFRRRVEEELLHAGRSVLDSVGKTLEESLSRVVDEWSEKSLADYHKLAEEVAFEEQERMARPSMAGVRGLYEDAGAEDAEERPNEVAKKIGKRILGFGPKLGEALQNAGNGDAASQLVTWGRVLNTVGPLLEQLGDMVFETADEIIAAQRAKERARERANLTEQLRQETIKIEQEAAAAFNAACDGLRQWLHDRMSSFQDEQTELKRRIEKLRDGARRIDQVLGTVPTDS